MLDLGTAQKLLPYLPYYIASIAVGTGAAFQISILGSLKRKLEDAHLVNLINFASGLVFAIAVSNHLVAPLYSDRNEKRAPFKWWMLCGGAVYIALAYLIAAGSEKVGGFGVIFFNFGIVSVSSFLDHIGFWGMPRRRITKLKLLGILIFIAGMLVATLVELFEDPNYHEYINWYLLCYLFAGMLIPIRTVFNVKLSKGMYYTTQAPTVNYFFASCIMLIIFGANFAANSDTLLPYRAPEWYECFPGAIEVMLTVGGIVITRRVGVSVYSMIITMTIMAVSFIFDASGFLRLKARPMDWGRGWGLVLVIIGCVIMMMRPGETKERNDNTDPNSPTPIDMDRTTHSEAPELSQELEAGNLSQMTQLKAPGLAQELGEWNTAQITRSEVAEEWNTAQITRSEVAYPIRSSKSRRGVIYSAAKWR